MLRNNRKSYRPDHLQTSSYWTISQMLPISSEEEEAVSFCGYGGGKVYCASNIRCRCWGPSHDNLSLSIRRIGKDGNSLPLSAAA
jgi:hypothetical protein